MTDNQNQESRPQPRDSRERSDDRGSRFGGAQRDRSERPDRADGGSRKVFSGAGRRSGRFGGRRKVCQFCHDNIQHVDYKDIARLRRHVGERGKIEPRRKLGTCARHQRSATVAIKRARYIGLLPFTTSAGRG
jgi:small subunit ribosomal protein S18